MKPAIRNATRVIASNSFWYSFESLFAIAMVFLTSIPMAVILGPVRLNYFLYVTWITGVGTLIAAGIPSVTSKYMAEYLSRGEHGIARAIFDQTLWMQVVAAALITASGELVVILVGDPRYRTVSMIQVFAMLPAMVIAVPSQANNAAENMRGNVAGSIVSSTVYLLGVVASLYFHWDLMGIAIGFALSRIAELLVRLPPVIRRVHSHPKGEIPLEVRPAMRTFAINSVLLLLINMVVWDKSDVFMLKWLSRDDKQISFFSLAFNIVEKIVLLPQVFGHALGMTMMAEYGRDQARVALMARSAAKYMYLFAAPPLFGLALLSGPLIRSVYGHRYVGMIPVLAVGAGLALFKPLLLPVQYYFRAHNRQKPLLIWNTVCGALNVGVDYTLIPGLGALGASIGNGVAQSSAVVGIWVFAIWKGGLTLDFVALFKITVAVLAMAPPVLYLNSVLPPVAALILGVPTGAIVFLGVIRWMGVLDAEDCARLKHVSASVPAAIRPTFQRLVDFMVPVADERSEGKPLAGRRT